MARHGFAKPRERLTDDKIQSMSSAELKAEAHQRGWQFGDMGARSARVLFWQLQNHYMGSEPQPEAQMLNASTPEARHQAHLAEKERLNGEPSHRELEVNDESAVNTELSKGPDVQGTERIEGSGNNYADKTEAGYPAAGEGEPATENTDEAAHEEGTSEGEGAETAE